MGRTITTAACIKAFGDEISLTSFPCYWTTEVFAMQHDNLKYSKEERLAKNLITE